MSRKRLVDFLHRFTGESKKILTPLSYNVFAYYADPKRHYHTMQHILMGIEEIDELRRDTDIEEFDKSAMGCLEFAWWYHDIVYDPMRKDNEESSAYEAENDADDLGLHFAHKKIIKNFIMATKIGHTPQNIYEKYIQDIDLVIFGQSKQLVFRYDDDIVKEYVTDGGYGSESAVFYKGRGLFLNLLLDQAKENGLYKTKYFKKYESTAIRNLENLIAKRYE